MKKNDAVFKIRNAEGLFSTGGSDPNFHERGKVWPSQRAVKLHIAAPMRWQSRYASLDLRNKREFYRDCEIVRYEMTESEITNIGSMYPRKQTAFDSAIQEILKGNNE